MQLTIPELLALYKYLASQYIPYEDEVLHKLVKRLRAYLIDIGELNG